MTTPKFIFTENNIYATIIYAGLSINVNQWISVYYNTELLCDTLEVLKSAVDDNNTEYEICLDSVENGGICSIVLKNDIFSVTVGCATDILSVAVVCCVYNENKPEIDRFVKYIYDGLNNKQ